MTKAEISHLQAVNGGKAYSRYSYEGHVLKGDGLSSRVLWSLFRKSLIDDGAKITSLTYRMALTKLGEQALRSVTRPLERVRP